MIEFIIDNYYVILVICILLIFATIGYIIDTLNKRKYEEQQNDVNTYIPEEEIFIQKLNESISSEETEDNVDDLLNQYNKDQDNENS